VLSLLCTAAFGGCLDDGSAPALGEDLSELSVWQWPDDVQIPTQDTTRQVALAPFGDRLHMIYTDYASSTSTALMWSRWNGSSWTGEVTVGRNSDSRPALTAYADRLTLIYKPVGEGRLMMTSTASTTWTTPVTVGRSLGSYVPYNPSALAYGGKLYLSYCASNGTSSYVYVDRFDGSTWTPFRSIQASSNAAYTCQSALMAPMPDTGEVELIYNVVNAGNNTTLYSMVARQRAVIGRSTVVWNGGEVLPMKSMKPLSVVTCDGETHLVHGGYSSITEIWWSFREGDDWVTDAKVPNQWSGAGATLGCLNGTTTVMVHNVSGGTDLMQSVFGP